MFFIDSVTIQVLAREFFIWRFCLYPQKTVATNIPADAIDFLLEQQHWFLPTVTTPALIQTLLDVPRCKILKFLEGIKLIPSGMKELAPRKLINFIWSLNVPDIE